MPKILIVGGGYAGFYTALKLEKWLQLGGHADGDGDLLAVALREAAEESGLVRLHAVHPEIFDVDRHRIPQRKMEPAHWHYDLRFMIEADPREPLVRAVSESHELAWLDVDEVTRLNPEESMARMVRKTKAGRAPGPAAASELERRPAL